MVISQIIIEILKNVPYGKVSTYGQVATLAGSPKSARLVVRLLHSSTKKHDLPWHRIINSKGFISLKPGNGYELQKSMLESEGVILSQKGKIDLSRFLWQS